MKMKKLAVMASVLAVGVAFVQADVISWNVDNNGTIGGADVAGVVPVAGWINDWPAYATTDLTDDSGSVTTMDIAFTDNGTWSANGFAQPGADFDGTYNNTILAGYANNAAGQPVTLSLSQIPYAQYDLYVYVMSDDGTRVGTATDGASTYYFGANPDSINPGGNAVFTQATATDSSGFAVDANYVKFSGLTGADQTLSTTFYASDEVTGGFGGISAFQVVSVPEPATIGLIATMGGVLIMLRRRFMA